MRDIRVAVKVGDMVIVGVCSFVVVSVGLRLRLAVREPVGVLLRLLVLVKVRDVDRVAVLVRVVERVRLTVSDVLMVLLIEGEYEGVIGNV